MLVRTFVVAALILATVATVPTGAQAALTHETARLGFAPDLHGTITITTESLVPGGASKRSFVLTARGAADQTSGVPVDVAVGTYDMTYLVYDPETDDGRVPAGVVPRLVPRGARRTRRWPRELHDSGAQPRDREGEGLCRGDSR